MQGKEPIKSSTDTPEERITHAEVWAIYEQKLRPFIESNSRKNKEFEDSLNAAYDLLWEKVVTTNPLESARELLVSEEKDRPKQIIQSFGKSAFDAVFSSTEILQGWVEHEEADEDFRNFDMNKVVSIIRFLSWLISRPTELTLDDLKCWSDKLTFDNKLGVTGEERRFFIQSIMYTHASERSSSLQGM